MNIGWPLLLGGAPLDCITELYILFFAPCKDMNARRRGKANLAFNKALALIYVSFHIDFNFLCE